MSVDKYREIHSELNRIISATDQMGRHTSLYNRSSQCIKAVIFKFTENLKNITSAIIQKFEY